MDVRQAGTVAVTLPVAMLCGGLATRLGSIAAAVPKILVDVAGVPFVEHQLALLDSAGFREVVFCVGHLGEAIEHYLGDGSARGMRFQYSYDGPQSLGTGGALQKALPLFGDRFLVLYGDSYLRCDYARISAAFVDSGKAGLMTVYRNDGKWDASNIEFRDGRIIRYDKRNRDSAMCHIDFGLGGLTKTAFENFKIGTAFDLAAVYQHLLRRHELLGYEVQNRFFEIGSPAGLEELRHLITTDRL